MPQPETGTSNAASSAPLPPVASKLLARARRELQCGDAVAAEQALAGALALAPDNLEVARLMGIAAQNRGDHAKAVGCFRRALTGWPDDADLHIGLGVALYHRNEIDEAIRCLRRACALAPGSASAWYNLGEALKREAYTAEAIDALERALAIDPEHIPSRLQLARAHASIGQVDLAVSELRDVLRREPDNAKAWFGLSNFNTFRFDAEDARRLRAAYARQGATPETGDMLGFALAKALEDQGDYVGAFDVFARVNASRRRYEKWDAAGERARAEAILRVLGDWTQPSPVDPRFGREAILIVSIPRSGSTLVEQILASHPEVEGANEIQDLSRVIDGETRRRGVAFPLWVPDAGAPDWRRLGEAYLARTARWRERKPRFVDKNLVAWYVVGPALAMLPAMCVVVVRRDPVETCLACFRQWLTGDAGFAYDLDEMADYCIDFMRLTRFWLEKYPDRVFDLEYETLTAEPETTIRRLLDFCGLPFDASCLEFHRNPRTVLSAPSAAQVRQPMRRDTARAARYGDRLDPLRARLRNAGLIL
jgi:tetratricopeptide (TPR) repeat protein